MPKIIYYTRHYVNRLAIEIERIGDEELKTNMILELREIQSRSEKGEIKIVEELPKKHLNAIQERNIVTLFHAETGQMLQFDKIYQAALFLETTNHMLRSYELNQISVRGYEIFIKNNYISNKK